jgi:hypothetical protein
VKKEKYIIALIFILSIIAILQINFDFIPKYIVGFSEKVINNINSIINDISIGLIVSIFLWMIIQYIPDKNKRISIHKIIEPKIRSIALKMEEQIGMIVRENCINKDISEMTKNDLNIIVKLINSDTTFVYSLNGIVIHPEIVNRIDLLNKKQNDINKMIEEILQIPSIIYEDDAITNCLSSIKESAFSEMLKNGQKNDIVNGALGLYMYDYLQKLLLLKHNFIAQQIKY